MFSTLVHARNILYNTKQTSHNTTIERECLINILVEGSTTLCSMRTNSARSIKYKI